MTDVQKTLTELEAQVAGLSKKLREAKQAALDEAHALAATKAEEQCCPAPLDSEYKEVGWAVTKFGDWTLKPVWIPRPNVTKGQVRFELLYSGVCHSDCHIGKSELFPVQYPFVGGHELLGRCVEVGDGVTRCKVGDIVAVGCMVDACLDCDQCKRGEEQFCRNVCTWTYGSDKKHPRTTGNPKVQTHGGYSGSCVTHEHFVLKVPDGMDLQKTAPILCAGITLYDPLRHWGFTKTSGKTVGIVGVGGLGTMGIKIAKALGHKVIAISTTDKKKELALGKGADEFVASRDPESMKAATGKCNIILNTAPVPHDATAYLPLLDVDGVLVQLGLVTEPHPLVQMPLIFARKSIAGALIGGIKATEECLELCAKHNIYPDVKLITADGLTDAWHELCHGNNAQGVRYVIDVKKSLENKACLPK